MTLRPPKTLEDLNTTTCLNKKVHAGLFINFEDTGVADRLKRFYLH